jgi:hypothetical protein
VLEDEATEDAEDLPDWMQPLQTLSGIPGVQLKVTWVGSIADQDHPCIAQWLKQHAQHISHLTVEVLVSDGRLKLSNFSEAAAPCGSIKLTIGHFPGYVVDLAHLNPLGGSLQSLVCETHFGWQGTLRCASALNISQLTALHFHCEDIQPGELWGWLPKLTSLQQLRLGLGVTGDPSPLSALTALTYLSLNSILRGFIDGPAPFSLSSLQPLSTLQQLEVLQLLGHACAATSLQGLAGLSKLRVLGIGSLAGVGRLRCLEGISPGVIGFFMGGAPHLTTLAGIESCISM